MTNVGAWFGEHETTGRQRVPFLDPSLQCADLTGGKGTGAFLTKSREEFLGRPIWFGLEPGHHSRPRGLKWILPRAPVPRRLGSFAMRGANLAFSPCVRQTVQKAIEIRIAMREHVDAFTRGEPGEVMLDRSNFIEEPQRVQRSEKGPQAIFHRFCNG